MQPISYTLKRTRRRRSMALRVDPSGAVTVLVPQRSFGFFINRFVQRHADWIREKIAYFQTQSQQHSSKSFVDGELFPLWGINIPLVLTRPLTEENKSSCELVEGKLVIMGTDIPCTLRQWYRFQTEERLKELVPLWEARLGVNTSRVTVAEQKRRWGSCSRAGRVRFNWRLSMLSPELLEYVVVHELAHLRELNHSPAFWEIVNNALPDAKIRRKKLRQYRNLEIVI